MHAARASATKRASTASASAGDDCAQGTTVRLCLRTRKKVVTCARVRLSVGPSFGPSFGRSVGRASALSRGWTALFRGRRLAGESGGASAHEDDAPLDSPTPRARFAAEVIGAENRLLEALP